jgi:6-pyruvoyltetrahydropterin/6-carboxytetrahydropterin synthase
MKATITRKAHFNAAHRLYNKLWSDEKNLAAFGKCNNPNFHGHNYVVEMRVKGDIDEETGYVMDAKLMNDLLQREVIEKFDHKNLNLDTAEFSTLNPTAENIARVIYDKLKPIIGNEKELTIILHETERNYVEYNGH